MLSSAGAGNREGVAGKDGPMSEERREPGVRRKRGPRAGGEAPLPRGAEAEGEACTERLQRRAARIVMENSGTLSDALLEKAKKGDVSSIRLLIRLAERKKPRAKPVKKARGLTLAQQLALEPQWQGPIPGADHQWGRDPGPRE